MRTIQANCVDDAFAKGVRLLRDFGVRQNSRAGVVFAAPWPVATVYSNPMRRVLFNSVRDANPLFHICEALWLLAGRQDARWLDQFVGDFSSRFAESDGRLHGSYGFRWRKHFDMEGGGSPYLPDQLDTVVKLLRDNPQDRQAVITMWDPVADLGVPGLKDRPCNLSICLRVRTQEPGLTNPVLDITVFCRSNDLWWGVYGANIVQFSVLQEYLAARIGVGIGTYVQISNNFHAYEATINWGALDSAYEQDALPTKIVTAPERFDTDLELFFIDPSAEGAYYSNKFFWEIAVPMYRANLAWKRRDRVLALQELSRMPERCDWRVAAEAWCQRRMAKAGSLSAR